MSLVSLIFFVLNCFTYARVFFRGLSPDYGLGANWSRSSKQALSIKWNIFFVIKSYRKICGKGWASPGRLCLNETFVGLIIGDTFLISFSLFLMFDRVESSFQHKHAKTVKRNLIEKQRKYNQAKGLVTQTTQLTTLVF